MHEPSHNRAPGGAPLYQVAEPLYGGAFALLPADAPRMLAQSFVLPGELLAPALEADASSALQVVQHSPQRVAPGCAHFGLCGGCQYQHAGYAAQLEWKRSILAGLFAQAGLADLPPIKVHAAEPWAYRNRIRLRLSAGADGLRAGYNARGTNSLLPVHMCPIAAPLLWRGVEAILAAAAAETRAARWLAQAAEVELFTDSSQQALQATFFLADPAVARHELGLFAALCERLKEALPELTGAAAVLDPELTRRVRRTWDGQSWGAPGLNYAVAGREHWVSRGSFFQVNRLLVESLVNLVMAGVPERIALALDLFAGVGLFTQALAERAERVIAVEGADSAARDLAQGLARATRVSGRAAGALTAVHGSTLDFLAARQFDRERPDTVVLDPPRAGLGTDGAAILARMAPASIAYVSCDPTTLTRDLAVLLAGKYRITSVSLIDLFPQTFHIETVVHLTKT